ncbi:MAG TPA: LysR substrate-binding domain-containing protein [Alphaproteobacteria bacterium]|nr:LysR substrate-binding domain-containing protein [Alphaproteobacteria bacterium]
MASLALKTAGTADLPPRSAESLDFDLLRTFLTIVDCGGFTRASRRLGRTQSTVSLQVRRLEESLGRPVFLREGRSIRLTGEGELLLTYARRIVELVEEARARVAEPEVAGTVRLGTPEDFATTHLPQVLARFARVHPGVALEVSCDFTMNLLEAFSRGAFDLVLVKRDPQGAGGGVKVFRERLVWAAAPGFQPADGPLPLVLSPRPCVYRKRAVEALDALGQPWRIVYTSPSVAGIQAAVSAGLGATILPREMVPAGLQVLETGLPPLADTEIALYRAPGGVSRATERLAEHIVHSLEQASG